MKKKLFSEKTDTPYDRGYQSGRTTAIWFPIMPEKIVPPSPLNVDDQKQWMLGFQLGFYEKRSEINE